MAGHLQGIDSYSEKDNSLVLTEKFRGNLAFVCYLMVASYVSLSLNVLEYL